MAEQLAKEPLETNAKNSSSTPLPSTRSLCVVDHLPPTEGVVGHLPPTEDIQSPMLFRSKADQLCGHELIKALSNFKQSMVAYLSPSTRHNKSLEKEVAGMHPEDNQSHSRQQK
jgi:hypothetical protein